MEDHDGEGDMVTCPGDGEPLLLAPAWGQEEQLCQHPRVKAAGDPQQEATHTARGCEPNPRSLECGSAQRPA